MLARVADDEALAAAVAEVGQAALDRDLCLVAVGGLGDNGEHDLSAGELIENPLPHVEQDRRARSTGSDAHEALAVRLVYLGAGITRRRDGRRIGRAEHRYPVGKIVIFAQRWRRRIGL